MNIGIAYFSKFGNNKNLSEKLSNILTEKGAETRVLSVTDGEPGDLEKADIVVLSSPTRMSNPPGKMKRFIKKLSPPNGTGYAIVNTAAGSDQSKVIEVLGGLCADAGLQQAAEGLLITIKDMQGPVEDGYEEKLVGFADNLLRFSPGT